jgi:lysine N6-hydroxylase
MEMDLIGVGVGPANLSLAALLSTARERGRASLTATFLERNAAVFWHSQQMFPATLMQTEFYRDLVTPVDPTSRFSFLSYLKSNARLEQFFCSSTIYTSRREFQDYFNWVAAQIEDVAFSVNVTCVDYDPDANVFVVQAQPSRSYAAKHIVLGFGAEPKSATEIAESKRVVDVSRLLSFKFPRPLRRVLVVGGGQSAAECVDYLLDNHADGGTQINWVTSETGFHALDISNFSREVFSASYAQAFATLPPALREKILRDDKNVTNGISPAASQALYQRLYRLKHLPPAGDVAASVHPQANTEVLKIVEQADGASVTAQTLETGEISVAVYDCVILCTGLLEDEGWLASPLLGPELRRRIGKEQSRDGYAVAWDGPEDRKIFVQSQNKETHGIGDASFVTAPGRNAAIINSIAGKEIYKIDRDDQLVAL